MGGLLRWARTIAPERAVSPLAGLDGAEYDLEMNDLPPIARRACLVLALAFALYAGTGCQCFGERAIVARLYLGQSNAEGAIADSAFEAFLAEEITPRFPEGLTVYDAAGQWREAGGTIVRERTKVVEIVLFRADQRALIESVAASYRQRFHQQAVLLTMHPAKAQFSAP